MASIHLSAAKFSKIAIPVAPEDEQAKVVSKAYLELDNITLQIVVIEKNLVRSNSPRQSILKSAFEGKLIASALAGAT